MTLRAKLVLLVVGLVAAVLLALGGFLDRSFHRWSGEATEHELEERAALLASRLEYEHGRELQLEDDDEEHGTPLHDPAHPYRVTAPGGEVLLSRPGFPWPAAEAGRAPRVEGVTDAGGRAWKIVTGRFPIPEKHGRGGTVIVQVAGPASPFTALEGPFRRGLVVAVAVALLLAALAAAALTHASLAPLDRLAGQVDAIGARSLDRRVAEDGLPPELRGLARAFNALLGRLEEAMQRERQLVARASHALRTPIATIRSRAEVTLRRDRDPEAYRAALREVDEAAAEAGRLVQGLLQLSRLDEAGREEPREDVELAALVAGAVRLLSPRAELAGVALEADVGAGLRVRATPGALRELVEALLDNAVHYTPRGGRAGVRAAAAPGGGAELRVWDTGPGIPAEERERVLERFQRGAAAQASGRPGSGLGLAIVKAIADAHGATLTLGDRPGGGLEVAVAFPPALDGPRAVG
ncbi:MAG: HAMP domain-containing sensor histidine kinase [Anaeromyxobacteraceae bacterium]